MDLNKDGFLTEDEIRQRFHVTTKGYRKKEVLDTMKQQDEGTSFPAKHTIFQLFWVNKIALVSVKLKKFFRGFRGKMGGWFCIEPMK